MLGVSSKHSWSHSIPSPNTGWLRMFQRRPDAAEHVRFTTLVHGPLIGAADGIKCLFDVGCVKIAKRDAVDAGLGHHEHIDFSEQTLRRQVVDVVDVASPVEPGVIATGGGQTDTCRK